MYKPFRAGNAHILCKMLNEKNMQIHTLQYKNGSFTCVAIPSDDTRELKSMAGPYAVVTENLNKYQRQPEYIALNEMSAVCFYRHDDSKEKEMAAKHKKEADAKSKAEAKAEKDAKRKALEEKQKALNEEMKALNDNGSKKEDSKEKAKDKKQDKKSK